MCLEVKGLSYLSLYRKWRPYHFEEVVGQEVVVKILSNSLKEQKVAHAYLFSGPRGVGKTTTARILSMAVNCREGVTPTPCGACESCLAIRQGNSLDVLEIDAASHRGIDEIRELREKVKYAPLESRFKVYIIDEVHMLTNEAFNALLKTLEEPPPHVIFILATTDVHRIPETITSRCVRLLFNPIAHHAIVKQLEKMAQEEGIDVEEEVFHLIARKSEGSLRDAEVFLEQLLAWGARKIDIPLASQVLREVDDEELLHFFEVVQKGARDGVFLCIHRWIERGLSPEDIVRSLVRFFRDLLVISVLREHPVFDIPEERRARLQAVLASVDSVLLPKALEELQNTEVFLRRSLQPRIALEIGALKVTEVMSPSEPRAPGEERSQTPVSPGSPGPPEPASPSNGGVNDDFWPRVLEEIKKAKISLYAFLQAAEIKRENASKLKLLFAPHCQFHRESVERKENLLLLGEVLKKVTGGICEVECATVDTPTTSWEAPPAPFAPSHEGKKIFQRARKENKPLLLEITDLFSGIVVNYSVSEEIRGEWEGAELEKPDEGSPEDAGENG
ncbi:MAG: DNA polymerase III subunit gamma/tau [Candidatus Caldatribacteriaceae bacterium]